MKKYLILTWGLLLTTFWGMAQIPNGYYDGTDGLAGQDLKTKLHQIIRNHKVRSYSEFRDVILPTLDEDPDNPDNIILFYKNNSIPKSDFAVDGDSWNREHTWPKSHGFAPTSDTAYTDAHNLRPSDASVNSSKSNKDFNDVPNTVENEEGEAPDTYTTSDFWEPRDEIKGDVARILLYMDVRYESNRLDLELMDYKTYSGDPELGVLYTLLRWHVIDPVDDYERERHEGIYGYQQNRNPFIDHPEYVSTIWGDVSGPFLSVDESTFNADFGALAFGAEYVQSYDINAYNLEGDIAVAVESPFFLSLDDSNFSNEVVLAHSADATSEQYTIYVKFEPQEADGSEFVKVITHESPNMTTVNLEVEGQEGEASLLSIAQARTKSLGTVVDVTGVVLGGENNSSRSRVIDDGTAGIVIRSPDGATDQTGPLEIGDSVVVSGALSEYANLLQINGEPMNVTLIAKNAGLAEPKELTIAEIGEKYESQLVILKDVRFTDAGKTFDGGGSDGNFEIFDDTGTTTFRIGNAGHPLVGTIVPSGLYDVVGYIGQFVDDYQISPRDVSDVTPVETEPTPEVMITIAEARTKPEGEVVKVKGLIIGGPNNNAINRVLYDGTAGLVVRGTELGNLSSELSTGDSVIVSGGILDYNGLFELEEGVKIELLNSGNALPSPQEITIAELGEEYESELVAIKSVSIASSGNFEPGNYSIADATGSTTFRIGSSSHELIGTRIPSGDFDLIGYVGQDNDKYQLFTSSIDDLTIKTVLGNAEMKMNLVYPNPVSDWMNIRVKGELSFELSIYKLDGQLVSKRIMKNSILNVSNFDHGLYVVLVETDGQKFYAKVYIQ